MNYYLLWLISSNALIIRRWLGIHPFNLIYVDMTRQNCLDKVTLGTFCQKERKKKERKIVFFAYTENIETESYLRELTVIVIHEKENRV